MTEEQRLQIKVIRYQGIGYMKIAEVGLSEMKLCFIPFHLHKLIMPMEYRR